MFQLENTSTSIKLMGNNIKYLILIFYQSYLIKCYSTFVNFFCWQFILPSLLHKHALTHTHTPIFVHTHIRIHTHTRLFAHALTYAHSYSLFLSCHTLGDENNWQLDCKENHNMVGERFLHVAKTLARLLLTMSGEHDSAN